MTIYVLQWIIFFSLWQITVSAYVLQLQEVVKKLALFDFLDEMRKVLKMTQEDECAESTSVQCSAYKVAIG